MVRLSNKQAGELLAVLVWLKEQQQEIDTGALWGMILHPREDEYSQAMDEGVPARPVTGALFGHVREYGHRINLSSAIDVIADQLAGGTPAGDVTLVDKLLTVLTGPHAMNRITGPVITDLRKALLSQDEQTKVVALLEKKDLACANCGAEFGPGEMATAEVDSYGTSLFVCARCERPSSQRCQTSKCEERIAIDLASVRCSAHRKEGGEVNSTNEVAFDGQIRWGAGAGVPDPTTPSTAQNRLRDVLRAANRPTPFTPPPTRRNR